ncbi:hypothetical protein KVP06_11920 [Geobacter sulfurreducens]|uniref:Uncharacterized protein n=1 Tax=Geobacter sulfurreducens (strain ATCC 51573 / DSM 12127 / PCA) TaxID=243231 RepID=Q74AH8_GEOSL|nr:hypothetical protein [Geobacter sulfurreducens]AAR35750.1 hypothetical protein GSU2377 [Geobacter sulfurreducens PCA]ADI85131.1 hypothetical protein KN400_2319 [Geobacter sulfurreducens KN400]UAC03080.1 hypothetical protein KVP06_11920 [Geobacter sulfurreducens]UTG91728.1 hypothetical protein J8622_11890 [Geobacter sulfurreducens]HBB68468.1 hypothetical protein [Geobacter sulfurreducens]
MRPINTILLRLAKRAETYNQQHIINSFVDVGPLFTLLSNPDNQILFGRRGTGKTHVLGYLANEVQRDGVIAIQLDMRTIGSTGGIYSDPRLTLPERATRLLVDTLCAIHDRILTEGLEKAEEYDLSALGPLLDNFIDAATNVVVEGTVEVQESKSATSTSADGIKGNIGASANGLQSSLDFTIENKNQAAEERRTKREGTECLRVRFGAVGREFEKLVTALPQSQLWIVFDEWSEIPLDLQPYLADLLRRTVLPVRGVTVKIAAIEQRCRFRIPDEAVGHIGIEIGADAAASINLDEFLVFDNNPDLAKQFFRELLHRHVKALVSATKEMEVKESASEFINDLFTQRPAFEEFVRSAEGVPRDAINIIGVAAQKALDHAISVPDVRAAARTWYTRAKQQAVSTKPLAQDLLNWIVDEVIQHRQARAFLLGSEVKDDLVDFLYDARVLHIIRQGVSAQDIPGRRFNVYALDYGCYVDLINTSRAPQGLFEVDVEGKSGFVDVPYTDFRSIRRAILELSPFYAKRL